MPVWEILSSVFNIREYVFLTVCFVIYVTDGNLNMEEKMMRFWNRRQK